MSKNNSGCLCAVPRIALANESIPAHRRDGKPSLKRFEPHERKIHMILRRWPVLSGLQRRWIVLG